MPTRPNSGELRIDIEALAPGHSIPCTTRMMCAPAAEPPVLRTAAELARDHAARQAQWNRCSRISSQDELVQGLFDRARFSLHGMIADNGTMDAGIFEYGDQWVRDTSNTMVGLLHAGHFELPEKALRQVFASMISDHGRTMISGEFDESEREEFDEIGELPHALRCYVEWTGDTQPIRDCRGKILAVIERPPSPQFRHSSGMIQGRREYRERITAPGLEPCTSSMRFLALTARFCLTRSPGFVRYISMGTSSPPDPEMWFESDFAFAATGLWSS